MRFFKGIKTKNEVVVEFEWLFRHIYREWVNDDYPFVQTRVTLELSHFNNLVNQKLTN